MHGIILKISPSTYLRVSQEQTIDYLHAGFFLSFFILLLSFVDFLFKMNIFRVPNGLILIRTKLSAKVFSRRNIYLLLLFVFCFLLLFFFGGGRFLLFFILTILSPFFLPHFHLYTCFIFYLCQTGIQVFP